MAGESLTSPYLRLRAAQQLFAKAPGELDAAELVKVEQTAARLLRIEQAVLDSAAAASVVVADDAVQQAVDEISSRYPSADDFHADLARSGIDGDQLRRALARELKADAVIAAVGSQLAAVSEVSEVSECDVELYYLLHREQFRRPELRTLRHILLTINEQLPGNERAAARARIDEIRLRLLKSPRRFGEQAFKHSECPTAMDGGRLGSVRRGQLYAELEAAAFALAVGELSAVVESPLGFHLVQCLAVEADGELPFSAVRQKISDSIAQSRRKAAIKRWIAGLLRQPA